MDQFRTSEVATGFAIDTAEIQHVQIPPFVPLELGPLLKRQLMQANPSAMAELRLGTFPPMVVEIRRTSQTSAAAVWGREKSDGPTVGAISLALCRIDPTDDNRTIDTLDHFNLKLPPDFIPSLRTDTSRAPELVVLYPSKEAMVMRIFYVAAVTFAQVVFDQFGDAVRMDNPASRA